MTTTFEDTKKKLDEVFASIQPDTYNYIEDHKKLKRVHKILGNLVYDNSVSYEQFMRLCDIEVGIKNKIERIEDDMIKENQLLLAIERGE